MVISGPNAGGKAGVCMCVYVCVCACIRDLFGVYVLFGIGNDVLILNRGVVISRANAGGKTGVCVCVCVCVFMFCLACMFFLVLEMIF